MRLKAASIILAGNDDGHVFDETIVPRGSELQDLGTEVQDRSFAK